MLRHYLQVKAEHPDAILLYRMGDFFEMFYEDAAKAAPILEIALTARQRGTENEAPMCGVPHQALESYLGKLVRAGLKVAICDQVEDAGQAKGLVRREVTRVVTPGTLSEPELLEGKEDNLLCALSWPGAAGSNGVGAGAFLDVSTGKLLVHRWRSAEDAVADLAVLRPRELVFAEEELPPEVSAWADRERVCRSLLDADDRLGSRGVPATPRAAVPDRQPSRDSVSTSGIRRRWPPRSPSTTRGARRRASSCTCAISR